MKVQLEPHENKILAGLGYYQVSDFALAVSNSSDLCLPPITIPTCEFDLEGEMWSSEITPDVRDLSGKSCYRRVNERIIPACRVADR